MQRSQNKKQSSNGKTTRRMQLPNDEAAILSRVIEAEQEDLSPAAAKALLKLHFTQHDRNRMHELAIRNQEGALTATEQAELASYLRIGRFLDLLSARARRSLANRSQTA